MEFFDIKFDEEFVCACKAPAEYCFFKSKGCSALSVDENENVKKNGLITNKINFAVSKEVKKPTFSDKLFRN